MKSGLFVTYLFILKISVFLWLILAAIFAWEWIPNPFQRSLYAYQSIAVPAAINPVDCSSQTPPVIGYEVSRGQNPDDEEAFLNDLISAGYNVGTVDINAGSIPSCADILVVMGLANNQHLNTAYSASEGTLLQQWTHNGHSLMLSGDWGMFRAETQNLFAAFGYDQAGSFVSDPSDFDPAGPSNLPNSWVIYQADNFSAHPILNGISSLQLQASSWFSPNTNAIVLTDNDASPSEVPVMIAFPEGDGCVLFTSDSNWLATTNSGAYSKQNNADVARQAINWLYTCSGQPPPPTATPTPVPAATPTITPLPTPVNGNDSTFLPLVLHHTCNKTSRWADIMLVLDTSASMRNPTEPGGPTKLEAAHAAAAQFLNLLTFPGDQAGIVHFNSAATLTHVLSDNRESLVAALASAASGTTRIDLAIAEAREELIGPRHVPINSQGLILLTDGLPNGSDEAAVVTEANITKSWGIVIYSIGLGSNVNTGLLRNISTSPDHYFEAPSTEELNAIYQQIAELISCS